MIGLRSKRIISDTVIYIVLTLLVVIWLFPLVWMILKAFDVLWLGPYSPTIFPEMMGMDNFKNLFGGEGYQNYPYGQWLLNTFFVAVGSCIISTLMTLMVSFALSRLRFKARKKLMNISMLLGLFPGFLAVIALYYIFSAFGIAGRPYGDSEFINLVGLMLAYSLAAGTGFYIVKGFFDTVPIAIDEAARIDGATKNRIFWRMIIPLSKPIIIYTILTSFIGPWCDFILASVFLTGGQDNLTIAVGIRTWISGHTQPTTHFSRFCAGSVLIAVPITILYLIMQKFYVAGITGGAAKG